MNRMLAYADFAVSRAAGIFLWGIVAVAVVVVVAGSIRETLLDRAAAKQRDSERREDI